MLRFRIFLSYVWFLAAVASGSAQDTVFRYYPQLTRYTILDSVDSWQGLDTALTPIYRFHPAEATFGAMHLGYLGAPARNNYAELIANANIQHGFASYRMYRTPLQQVRFFDSRLPYTVLSYQQGSKQELVMRALHTQNLSARMSAGICFLRRRTDGFYQRQLTRLSDGYAFFRYKDSIGFYSAYLAGTLFKVNAELNGGVRSDSVFEDRTLFNKKLVPVVLQEASEQSVDQNIVWVNAFILKRQAGVGDDVNTLHRALRLEHRIAWQGYRRFFQDGNVDSAAYHGVWPPEGIRDSFIVQGMHNTFGIHSRPSTGHAFTSLQFMHEYLWLKNRSLKEQVSNMTLHAEGGTGLGPSLYLSARAYVTLAGRNKGDYLFEPQLKWRFLNHHLGLRWMLVQQHPPLMAERYSSSLFTYDQLLPVQQMSRLLVWWKQERWRLNFYGSWISLKNFVYWTDVGPPRNGSLRGWQVGGTQHIAIKPLMLDLEIMGQWYVPDSVVSFPSVMARSSCYYQQRWFSGSSQVRIGFELRWSSAYYLPTYLPVLAQFAEHRVMRWQSTPEADVYLVIFNRGIRAFVLVQQALQGIWGSGNYYGYLYPGPDRSFKIGVEWWFWN
ncbi:MAG: hypothetical protein NZL95_08335 [Chitinophagales bacterium]|nr:hypothetical protein [Chitinophagales bacterium]MDW8428545.1 putative porin [Chitinophagales bacterium]